MIHNSLSCLECIPRGGGRASARDRYHHRHHSCLQTLLAIRALFNICLQGRHAWCCRVRPKCGLNLLYSTSEAQRHARHAHEPALQMLSTPACTSLTDPQVYTVPTVSARLHTLPVQHYPARLGWRRQSMHPCVHRVSCNHGIHMYIFKDSPVARESFCPTCGVIPGSTPQTRSTIPNTRRTAAPRCTLNCPFSETIG